MTTDQNKHCPFCKTPPIESHMMPDAVRCPNAACAIHAVHIKVAKWNARSDLDNPPAGDVAADEYTAEEEAENRALFEKWFFEIRKAWLAAGIVLDENDANSAWLGFEGAMTIKAETRPAPEVVTLDDAEAIGFDGVPNHWQSPTARSVIRHALIALERKGLCITKEIDNGQE